MFLHGIWIEEECDVVQDEAPLPLPPVDSLSEFFAPMGINEETQAYIMFVLNKQYHVHTLEDLKQLTATDWTAMRVSSIVKRKIMSSPKCMYTPLSLSLLLQSFY